MLLFYKNVDLLRNLYVWFQFLRNHTRIALDNYFIIYLGSSSNKGHKMKDTFLWTGIYVEFE